MPRLSALSVDEIYRQSASTAPTPGGGSVTALCGMLGIALILKALRITRRRRPDEALDAAETALESLAGTLDADAEADIKAFDAFMQAARTPREDEGQRAERTERMQRAAAAAEAALDTLEHACVAIEQADRVEGQIATVVAADLRSGRRLLRVTVTNAIDNAMDNLESAGPPGECERLSERLASLTAHVADPAA